MKNIYFHVLCIALFMVGIAFMDIGCTRNTNPPNPQAVSSSGLLGAARMTLSVDKTTFRPLKITDVFKKDAQTIYCSIFLLNAPERTLISAYLFLIKGEGGAENLKLSGSSVEADGSRFLYFSWVRPGDAWTSGDYKAIISVNGNQDLTVPFKIK